MPITLYPPCFFRNTNILADAKGMEDMSKGFIKILREAQELFEKDHDAYDLLMLMAFRASWKDSKYDNNNLKPGESFIGRDDVNKIFGWGERTYRNVKKRVEQKYKLATFKGTNQGTIAKFTDNSMCDLNLNSCVEQKGEQKGEQKKLEETSKGRAKDEQRAPNKEQRREEYKKETTTSADAHDADFSYDPLKAKAMLEEFWKSCDQKQSQIDNYLKKGIGHCFAALRHVTDPSFTINTTAIQAFVWAFKTKPWLEKANQPKLMSNRERVERDFVDGEPYNKAICTINSTAISFHRGMKVGGAKFDDKTFMSNFSKVLDEFGIENPFKIKLDNVKEA